LPESAVREAIANLCIGSGNYPKLPNNYPITTQKMSEMELKILEVIKGNRSLSRDKIAETLGNITSDGVKYHLSSLQKKGLLKRVGGRKEGYWEVLVDIQ
jgi:predicted HTH transcriptional regulator